MGWRTPLAALAPLAVTVAACFAPVPVPPPSEHQPLRRSDVGGILGDLADMRGLRADRNVTVDLVPRTRIVAERAARYQESAGAGARYEAFLAGFDFIPPSAERSGMTAYHESVVATVGAFYDRSQNRVFAPDDVPTTKLDQDELRGILAHELHHALQAQHFPPPPLDDADAARAYRALIEGDAEAAAMAYLSKERGVPVRRSILHLRYRIEAPPRVDPTLSVDRRATWDRAPALPKTLLDFPYREGAAFVADLYRTGGFALVDRAYKTPPVSSEQILHPQKYLDGELPRPIRDLDAPAGLTITTNEVLGEIGVRVFLEPCLGTAAAIRASEGWAGDRAFVLDKTDRFVIAWTSAWDTEADAAEVEDALTRLTRCLRANDASGKSIGVAYSVRREGAVVAFVRGGEAADRAALLPALLGLPGAVPPAAPVVSARVPELRPPPKREQGTVAAGAFRSDWLGIWGPLPEGFTGQIGKKRGELTVRDPSGYGVGTLSLSGRLQTPDRMDKNLNEVERDLATLLGNAELQISRLGDDEIDTKIGPAYERSWLIKQTGAKQRLVVIPICGGAGGLVVDYSYGSGRTKRALEEWVASLQWLSPQARPPVCDYLEPR